MLQASNCGAAPAFKTWLNYLYISLFVVTIFFEQLNQESVSHSCIFYQPARISSTSQSLPFTLDWDKRDMHRNPELYCASTAQFCTAHETTYSIASASFIIIPVLFQEKSLGTTDKKQVLKRWGIPRELLCQWSTLCTPGTPSIISHHLCCCSQRPSKEFPHRQLRFVSHTNSFVDLYVL